MTLKQCYKALEGDYSGTVARLYSEQMVQKFLLRFLEDQSYEQLWRSFENHDYESAFQAAHILKESAQVLGLLRLFSSSEALAEALQNGESHNSEVYMGHVAADYKQTLNAIRQYQMEWDA